MLKHRLVGVETLVVFGRGPARKTAVILGESCTIKRRCGRGLMSAMTLMVPLHVLVGEGSTTSKTAAPRSCSPTPLAFAAFLVPLLCSFVSKGITTRAATEHHVEGRSVFSASCSGLVVIRQL